MAKYLISLGSNVRHHRLGSPSKIVAAACEALDGDGLRFAAVSRIVRSAPLGPSRREYANAVALVLSSLEPPAMLARLQAIEHRFGRRRRGQPWRARVLDLDIVLWSGGVWFTSSLAVPHRRFRTREFVLRPAARFVPDWRDPLTGLTLRQLHARLTRPRPLPRCPSWSGP